MWPISVRIVCSRRKCENKILFGLENLDWNENKFLPLMLVKHWLVIHLTKGNWNRIAEEGLWKDDKKGIGVFASNSDF